MHNAPFFVQILERLGHLHNNVPAQLLAEVCETHNLMEELSARTQFQNDEVVLA